MNVESFNEFTDTELISYVDKTVNSLTQFIIVLTSTDSNITYNIAMH